MSYRVVQHIPAFVELSTPREDERISTVEELLALPWVNRWTLFSGFDRFAVDPCPPPSQQALMAVMKDGKFWVVALIESGLDMSSLPRWKA